MGNLTNSMAGFVEDIPAAFDNRMTLIKDLKEDTRDLKEDTSKMLCHFQDDHSNMSKELHSFLSVFSDNLSDSTSKFMKKVAKEQKESFEETRNQRIAYVDEMLKMFHSNHQKMSEALKMELDSFTNELRNEVGKMRQEMADDIKGAGNEWKKMASIMALKRGGIEQKTKMTEECRSTMEEETPEFEAFETE